MNWNDEVSASVLSEPALKWRGLRREEQLHLRKCVSASVLSQLALEWRGKCLCFKWNQLWNDEARASVLSQPALEWRRLRTEKQLQSSAKRCVNVCFKSACSLSAMSIQVNGIMRLKSGHHHHHNHHHHHRARGLRTEKQLHLWKCVSASDLSHPAHWNNEDFELRNNVQGAEKWSFRTVSHSSCPFPLPSPTFGSTWFGFDWTPKQHNKAAQVSYIHTVPNKPCGFCVR